MKVINRLLKGIQLASECKSVDDCEAALDSLLEVRECCESNGLPIARVNKRIESIYSRINTLKKYQIQINMENNNWIPKIGDRIKIISGCNLAPFSEFYGIVEDVGELPLTRILLSVRVKSDLIATHSQYVNGCNLKGAVLRCYTAMSGLYKLAYEPDNRSDDQRKFDDSGIASGILDGIDIVPGEDL